MQLNRTNRTILLLELVIPIVLLILGIYNGLLQSLYRAGIIQSNSFLGIDYYQGMTMHGVINAIVLTTFFAVAFGNAVISYYLRKELNPVANMLSFGLMMVGVLLASWAMLTNNADVLYTFYAPLKAHPAFYIGLVLAVVGSWVAFFNWIKPYLSWRKENKGQKTPLAVVGILATFIMWFIATLPVAVQLIFFMIPWSMGWIAEINVMLTRVLFWFFGHPLVYFWLLPIYTMYYAMLPKIAGGKLFSDFAGRLTFMLFIVLSIPVGLHHQFSEPSIDQGLKLLHALLTFGVALPSFITAFTIAASLEHAGINNGAKSLMGWTKKLPYFDRDNHLFAYMICGLFIFVIGGVTGIVNASYGMNLVVHNTAYVPGHFHMTVAGPVFLGIIGMSLHMLHKLTGKPIQWPGWNVAVPYLWMFGLVFLSFGMMAGGILGEPRRTNMGLTFMNPDSHMFRPDWILTTFLTALGGIIMTISMIFYFIVFFKTLFAKKVEEPSISFPTAEAYHDENIGFVQKFTPWIIIAVIIIAFAYYGPIKQAIENPSEKSPPFLPESPVPQQLKERHQEESYLLPEIYVPEETPGSKGFYREETSNIKG